MVPWRIETIMVGLTGQKSGGKGNLGLENQGVGEGSTGCVQYGGSIWYLGEESVGRALSVMLHEHHASPESSGEALKGFKPG